jgi:protein tyrosine phosphatase (PTP) superfamily phosphohydrolase (DUF442 family)
MRHRLLSWFVCLAAALAMAGLARADEAPERPTAPKNVDQTPPLVPIPNARVSPAGLLVGGQPTREHLKAIQQAGYRTVISLRASTERGDEGEPALVERLGMKFASIPVAGPAGLTEETARALSRALDQQDALPAVVHCRTGERAAALLGLEAFVVDRVNASAAIDLAKGLGMKRLEKALRERIGEICRADPSRSCEGIK